MRTPEGSSKTGPDRAGGQPPASRPDTPAKPAARAGGVDKPAPAPRKRKPRRPPAPPPRRWPLLAGAGAVVLALDQASKWLVVRYLDLPLRHEMDLIDPWLNLRMAWNQGMNFGLLSSSQDLTRWLLIGVALAVCVWVGIWVWRSRPGVLAHLAAGLLIGGALGNVIDRLVWGAVADFLNMSLPGWRNPYSFNIADIAIFLGALGLVFQPQDRRPPGKAKPRKPAARRKPAAGGRAGGKAAPAPRPDTGKAP